MGEYLVSIGMGLSLVLQGILVISMANKEEKSLRDKKEESA